jgi:hypothetical protein
VRERGDPCLSLVWRRRGVREMGEHVAELAVEDFERPTTS